LTIPRLEPDIDFGEVPSGVRNPAPGIQPWLTDAADLLAQPDPGPTKFLVEDLIVDQALIAGVGRWKTTKTYGGLEIAIAVRTGRPAFGALEVSDPGPVVFVIEESGSASLWRRLDALTRGRDIHREELRGLHFAPNARVKLDDLEWQERLIKTGIALRPRLFVFDPLARMKAPAREENAQNHMAPLIEFLRTLRGETGAAVMFVHHTGHAGGNMRGSSDLESVWETRLSWERDGQSPLVTLRAEHREAESSDPIQYRINWDGHNRTMRFDLVADDAGPSLADRIVEHLREHGPGTTDEIRAAVQVRRSDVLRTLRALEDAGTTHNRPSGRRDGTGRPIRDKVWSLAPQAGSLPVPDNRITRDDPRAVLRGPSRRPVSLETDGTDEPPEEPPQPCNIDEFEVERLPLDAQDFGP
jgi:hypothetical protein